MTPKTTPTAPPDEDHLSTAALDTISIRQEELYDAGFGSDDRFPMRACWSRALVEWKAGKLKAWRRPDPHSLSAEQLKASIQLHGSSRRKVDRRVA